jgi:universal stress protein family protein
MVWHDDPESITSGRGEANMFTKIAVVLDESPEAGCALVAAGHLAKSLGAHLQAVTYMAELPRYTAFAAAANPSILGTLSGDRLAFYEPFQADARSLDLREGVELSTHLLDGEKVDAIIASVHAHEIDLLANGLHHRWHQASRLWCTVYTLAQDNPCSILGVH